MTYKVSLTSNSSISVKISPPSKDKVNAIFGGIQVPARFSDLADFNPTGLSDKYVIMYDSTTQTYVPVNPDTVLSAASNTEITQPGLPNDFIDSLDTDLDNKIDIDAGTF